MVERARSNRPVAATRNAPSEIEPIIAPARAASRRAASSARSRNACVRSPPQTARASHPPPRVSPSPTELPVSGRSFRPRSRHASAASAMPDDDATGPCAPFGVSSVQPKPAAGASSRAARRTSTAQDRATSEKPGTSTKPKRSGRRAFVPAGSASGPVRSGRACSGGACSGGASTIGWRGLAGPIRADDGPLRGFDQSGTLA